MYLVSREEDDETEEEPETTTKTLPTVHDFKYAETNDIFDKLPKPVVKLAEKIELSPNKLRLIANPRLKEHPELQKDLVKSIAPLPIDKARILVYQTIRDLETGALFKSGENYHVHTHLRDKIDDNKIEYTPYKHYFEIMKHSNELLKDLTNHPLTKGEYDYKKDHINYSAQHRIDIVKNLDSRSIVGLMEQIRMLRYALDSLESLLVSKEVNQNT